MSPSQASLFPTKRTATLNPSCTCPAQIPHSPSKSGQPYTPLISPERFKTNLQFGPRYITQSPDYLKIRQPPPLQGLASEEETPPRPVPRRGQRGSSGFTGPQFSTLILQSEEARAGFTVILLSCAYIWINYGSGKQEIQAASPAPSQPTQHEKPRMGATQNRGRRSSSSLSIPMRAITSKPS